MKHFVTLIVGLIVGLVAGLLLFRGDATERVEVRMDTVRVVQPVAKDSTVVRYKTVRLAVSDTSRVTIASFETVRDTLHTTVVDSVSVTLPITQKVYGDSTYTAWVSGYDAQIDSIKVVQRTESIFKTVPGKASRWSVGVTGGAGLTLKGVQPYLGIGISYRLFNIGK